MRDDKRCQSLAWSSEAQWEEVECEGENGKRRPDSPLPH